MATKFEEVINIKINGINSGGRFGGVGRKGINYGGGVGEIGRTGTNNKKKNGLEDLSIIKLIRTGILASFLYKGLEFFKNSPLLFNQISQINSGIQKIQNGSGAILDPLLKPFSDLTSSIGNQFEDFGGTVGGWMQKLMSDKEKEKDEGPSFFRRQAEMGNYGDFMQSLYSFFTKNDENNKKNTNVEVNVVNYLDGEEIKSNAAATTFGRMT